MHLRLRSLHRFHKRLPGRLLPGLLLACSPLPSAALQLDAVTVAGVGGEALSNIETRLSLNQQDRKQTLSEARLAYLLRQAPGEVLTALEPFGFYDATVDVQTTREADQVRVSIVVLPGRPVQVAERKIVVRGAGGQDDSIKAAISAFKPGPMEILDHRSYAASKAVLERSLAAHGYFDAEPLQHQIQVHRARYQASIDVAWDSGPRYNFAETRFAGSQIDPALLQAQLPYQSGQPYDQTALAELHRRLADLDYFGFIGIEPLLAEKTVDAVPIAVNLSPAKRSRYSAGIGFGTDSGPSTRTGLTRRYVNQRGDKMMAQLALGQRESSLGLQYRIPALTSRWPGWWSLGPSLRRQQFGDEDSDIFELVGARSARWHRYDVSLEAHLRRERHREETTTLIYPLLRIGRIQTDTPLYPARGYSWSLSLAHGDPALGSDLRFTQWLGQGRYIHALGARRRVLLRAELGHTTVDDNSRFPPSLRFYAGGDRSVRGYGYQEIGPRQIDPRDTGPNPDLLNIGGLKLATASIELEQMFSPHWGMAALVDAGDAWTHGSPQARVGVGLGLRWRSPVGPVRVDLGVGLDDPASSVQIHLNIGPDFSP